MDAGSCGILLGCGAGRGWSSETGARGGLLWAGTGSVNPVRLFQSLNILKMARLARAGQGARSAGSVPVPIPA